MPSEHATLAGDWRPQTHFSRRISGYRIAHEKQTTGSRNKHFLGHESACQRNPCHQSLARIPRRAASQPSRARRSLAAYVADPVVRQDLPRNRLEAWLLHRTSRFISDELDADIAVRWTRDAGVASIPLSVFCEKPFTGTRLRFCFAKDDATLEAAAQRLSSL